MAIKYSREQLEIAEINYYGNLYRYRFLKIFIYIFKKVLNRVKNLNNFLRRTIKKNKLIKKNREILIPDIQLNNNFEFDKIKKEFSQFGFCYVENLFPNDFYNTLKDNYPTEEFFDEPKSPLKNYKVDFRYTNKHEPIKGVKNIKLFPALDKLYKYVINSSEFENFINTVISNEKFKNFDIWTSYATEGSYLIPHLDSVASNDEFGKVINCIYFVDAGDIPEYSGGTGIYKDNQFSEPLIIPKNLKNSIIIYNSKSNFFHGFKIMKKNMFRKAISFQFMKYLD